MIYLVILGFLVGILVAYGLLAYPARKSLGVLNEDLVQSKNLLEEMQKSRDQLKQEVADQQYKLKELEKDLAFERSRKNS